MACFGKPKDKFGCDAWGADYGFFCPEYDEDTGATIKGVVGIAAGLPEGRMRSILLEELVQALGPQNDAPYFKIKSSLFYEAEDGTTFWDKRLSSRDEKLLRFLYLYLRPGDGPEELQRAFVKHWFSIPPALAR